MAAISPPDAAPTFKHRSPHDCSTDRIHRTDTHRSGISRRLQRHEVADVGGARDPACRHSCSHRRRRSRRRDTRLRDGGRRESAFALIIFEGRAQRLAHRFIDEAQALPAGEAESGACRHVRGAGHADRAHGVSVFLAKHFGWFAGFRFRLSALLYTLGQVAAFRSPGFQFRVLGALVNDQKVDGTQRSL